MNYELKNSDSRDEAVWKAIRYNSYAIMINTAAFLLHVLAHFLGVL